MTNKCPVTSEFELIKQTHSTLTSTGCTRDFCQSGRVIHTDEPRIGENRPIAMVEEEAQNFLRDLHHEGFFVDDEAFQVRLQHVLYEIRSSSAEGIIRDSREPGMVGGSWTQTFEELKFGVRRAWRNARKCIMRSHCEELKLCDLRSVTSSAKMAIELIRTVSEAFNNGNILPTVFVFPPRTANSRGPMIWNDQILMFAGYQAHDGSILGDPTNVQLTNAIIELGWEPPHTRSRWDLLPIVTMAEGDLPVIAELPSHLRALVKIEHPQYYDAFEELDLKWVPFPALSRLGFDIGGVQYTAAPFIGWFMDAEIGVRNLGDTFRYNALPDIVRALRLDEGALEDVDSFEDLPEYQQLAMLSRAQTELNYAVYHSFLREKVTMSDSLTASMKWTRFDDEFQKKNGYRLPSDPYWLAPPQGSIIPTWHRGGSPNYQPKPMICRHVQNPTKVWDREKSSWPMIPVKLFGTGTMESFPEQTSNSASSSDATLSPSTSLNEISILSKDEGRHDQSSLDIVEIQTPIIDSPSSNFGERQKGLETGTTLSVSIHYCSAGTIAEKLAVKLHDRFGDLIQRFPTIHLAPRVEPLDDIDASDFAPGKVFLLVISTTGTGDVPANGADFVDMCEEILKKGHLQKIMGFKYAIFGNGDSRYATSFNHGARKIDGLLEELGGKPLVDSPFLGDTALQSPPWAAPTTWWAQVQPKILEVTSAGINSSVPDPQFMASSAGFSDIRGVVPEKYLRHAQELRNDFLYGTLISTNPCVHEIHQGSLCATIDIGSASYESLSCIQLLPLNFQAKVDHVIEALGIPAAYPLHNNDAENPTFLTFLREFADLELPFINLQWLDNIDRISVDRLTKEELKKLSILDALENLLRKGMVLHFPMDMDLVREILFDMPLLRYRTYSVASSLRFISERTTEDSNNKVDVIVKLYQGGRFSDIFLRDADSNPGQAILKFRFIDSIANRRLKYDAEKSVPIVAITTGAGFGPIRSLLQERITIVRDALSVGKPLPPWEKGISLFVGLQRNDVALVTDIIVEAMSLNLIDMFFMVPSNAKKVRVQDKMKMEDVSTELRHKLIDKSGMVFVCTGPTAAKEIANVLESVVGGKVKRILGMRYIEEVF
ncbi:nitric oxide synthase-like protein [Collybia sordida]|uniref:nitric-oxide synthase (NADPH) n=1 Tax=Collybia sordida TaxID=123925 RepID=A0A8H3U0B0_9AGAR|nr:nitric oxide synthase-like protein [Collybia sordida]